MPELSADPNVIIVDKESGKTNGLTTIHYSYAKWDTEELWDRVNYGDWRQIDYHQEPEVTGETYFHRKFPISLTPGSVYEIAFFGKYQGPASNFQRPLIAVKVFCLWKDPEVRNLIIDQDRSTGGTWHAHNIATNVPTDIVMIGASREQPVSDSNGIPQLLNADGWPTAPLKLTDKHLIEIKPLLPGHVYFFAAVVADTFGNWEVIEESFTTLKRKLTVEFPYIHIYNDGDSGKYGEAQFWFGVHNGFPNTLTPIQEFHLPEQDIDDLFETSRQYSVGFAHVGAFETVEPGKEHVVITSKGSEDDTFIITSFEIAQAQSRLLPIPSGQFVETVIKQSFRLDCPATDGDDFHYGVDVIWSVEYGE